ncbi:MAG: alpha-L-rhamnosidase, partial [Paenibacillus sp.]|nr:alpha-L-rhamnosidase [Paenibacillus sp.]
MQMEKQWNAAWIMDREFAGLPPINLYHKELDEAKRQENRRKHSQQLRNRHMLVRKEFTLSGDLSDAVLDITGDDYYKVYVNGQFLGQGPAQGNHFHYYYNRFAIASFLHPGVNVIAVHVYYHGLICHSYMSGDHRQGVIAELTVGGQAAVKTDHTWSYHITEEYGQGSVIAYDTQFAEHIDNRIKVQGWREIGFDDSSWKEPLEHDQDDHQMYLQPTPPLSVYNRLPSQVLPLEEEGGYRIDFGQEITGQLRLRARGKAGQVVEIRCGEELLDNGRVRYDMRCNCLYQEFWTLSGHEDDELELFDYKAFRYAEVLADPGVILDTESFSAVVRHYPFNEDTVCTFDSSNPLLNAIWSMCSNGVKFGSQENYVDCPSREKGQYLGDNTIITHAHAYLAGDLRLFRKSLQDFAWLASRVCPGIMAVASGSYMQEIADFSFQWPMQLLQYYKQSGDLDFLKEMYPVAENMLLHFEQFRREDGLLCNVTDKWNLVDWPVSMRDGYDCKLSYPIEEGCHNVINAFYYGAMAAVSEIQQLLHGSVASELQRELVKVRAAFIEVFYNGETKLFVDAEGSEHCSLHANALPLLFGLVPEGARESVAALIREKRLSCGVYMSYFVLKALAEAGEYEFIYELITSDDIHSWGNMLKEGATTCFEVWSKD